MNGRIHIRCYLREALVTRTRLNVLQADAEVF